VLCFRLHCPVALHELAEALSRLFKVVRTAAAESNKQPQGVFAEFGKPYAPCGIITEVGTWRVNQCFALVH
jgi:hypothetical protein